MPLVNDIELAKAISRTREAVHAAVKTGRITQRPDGMFDLDAAVAEFAANTHHEKGHNNRSGAAAKPKPAEAPAEASEAKLTTYIGARAVTQTYEAKLKKLRYEERAGNLTPTADVEAARFLEFRTLREACCNIPSRIAALLAGESDVARCQQLLENELNAVFAAFANGKLAA